MLLLGDVALSGRLYLASSISCPRLPVKVLLEYVVHLHFVLVADMQGLQEVPQLRR